jgi:FkbM family methyltransferase
MSIYRLMSFDAAGIGGVIPSPRDILRQQVGRPDPVIFDVGANVGQSITRFRALFERPVIHAFEPDARAFQSLQEQFAGVEGVTLNPIALGAAATTAILHRNNFHEVSSLVPLDGASWWGRALDLREVEQTTVTVDTIDGYCAAQGIGTIDLLKVDVQGFEPECLRGAAGMLAARNVRAIQLEVILHPLYARPLHFADVETLLVPHGYRLFTVFDLGIAASGELMQLDAFYVPA